MSTTPPDLIAQGHYARKQLFSRSRVVAWSHGRRFAVARELAAAHGGGALLDYGCGDGTFIALAHDRFRRAVGTDADQEQLLGCRERLGSLPGVSFVGLKELRTPGQSGAYDVAMCMEVLEHCPVDVQGAVLDDLSQALAPGGVAIISVPIEIGATLAVKQAVRAFAAAAGLTEYAGRERYRAGEFVRMLLAGPASQIARSETTAIAADGTVMRYHGHKGFNWRRLERLIADRFVIDRRLYLTDTVHGAMVEQPGLVRVPRARSLIAAALRGEAVRDPPVSDRAAVLAGAIAEGVAPLLARAPAAERWHADLRDALKQAATAEAALALGRTRELERLLECFTARGVPSLLIKGAHLSRTCYASPELRPHGDVDILVAEAARASAERALLDAGYRRLAHVTGEVAFTQVHYWRDDESLMRHAVDLHWRIAAPRVFAERLTWNELFEARTPIAAIHPSAAGPSGVHALLIACIHRTAHHRNSDRLIWLHDIHTLAGGLTLDEWDALAGLAAGRGLAGLVLDALTTSARWLGTVVPAKAAEALAAAPSDPDAQAFLEAGRTEIQDLLSDWRALRDWRTRVRFVREHLVPERAYMAQRYGTASRAALPFLYAHRVFTGVWRWL